MGYAQSAGPAATGVKYALSALTLAVAIQNPGEFISACESPSAAAGLLANDVAFVAFYGKRTIQFIEGYIAARTDVQPVAKEIAGLHNAAMFGTIAANDGYNICNWSRRIYRQQLGGPAAESG
ncbi:MAG: hypothetical protein WCO56_00090 [Verrucomicrobiota bacterium]